jgi:outer membrane receptor for ferrienterochelin and colicins
MVYIGPKFDVQAVVCRILCVAASVALLPARSWGDGLDGADESLSMDIPLAPVVITATRTERTVLEVPVRTEIIGIEEIEMTRSLSLADVLEYQSGLRVENNCSNCGTSEIRMLGLQQRYINILTDSMMTFSGLAGVYGIEQIPMITVDRIEVVKGGGSTLYGPNAVAGVVNIIPRNPTHRHAMVDFSYNLMDGDVSGNRPNTNATGFLEYVSKDGKAGMYVYGFQNFRAGVDLSDDRFTEITRQDLMGAGTRIVYDPYEAVRIAFDYIFSTEDRRGGEDQEGLDQPANLSMLAEELFHTRHVGAVTLDHEVTDSMDYRIGASVAYTGRDSYYGGVAALGYAPPGSPLHDSQAVNRLSARFPEFAAAFADPGGIFYNPAWTPQLGYGTTEDILTSVDTVLNKSFGYDHTLSFGYQLRLESIEDEIALDRSIDEIYSNNGVFVQHDWMITDDLEVLYGLRVDKHSEVDDPILSPRGTIKYSVNEGLDIRLSGSSGFRAPEVFDEDLHISNVGGELVVTQLDPNLTHERSWTMNLGINYRPSSSITFDGNLFYTGIDDLFFNDLTTDDPSTDGIIEATKINSGSAEVYGVDLNVSWRPGNYGLELGYVEQRSLYGESQTLLGTPGDPVDNEIIVGRFERMPDRYGVITASYDDGRLSGFISGKFTGSMDVPHVVNNPLTGDLLRNELKRSDFFFAVDVGLGYTWALPWHDHSSFSLTAGIKNVFNTFQDDLDDGPFRDPSYIYGPRFPRTFYVGGKIEL